MAQFLRFTRSAPVMAMTTLVIVSLIVFTLMELVPGDCAERYLAFKNTQAGDHRRGYRGGSASASGSTGRSLCAGGVDRAPSGRIRRQLHPAREHRQLLGDKFLISLGSACALLLAYLIAMPVGIIAAASRNPVAQQLAALLSAISALRCRTSCWR
jgi:peptide/nickel transport system permease protein